MPFIDYPALKKLVTLEQVLTLIRYNSHRRQGQYWYGPCPLQCPLRPRCTTFDMDNNCWYCRTCARGGNQMDLYRQVRGIPLYHACVELCEKLNITIPVYR